MNQSTVPDRGNTVALIVSYYPDDQFQSRLERVLSQVEAVIIIDNTPGEILVEVLNAITSEKVEIIRNAHNPGLGYALNQGMHRAIERGYTWVLTLDQDTFIDSYMLEHQCLIATMYPDHSKLAVIASNSRFTENGRIYESSDESKGLYCDVAAPMTSGSLMSVAAFKQLGDFREDFFIGSLDIEYCLRARSRKFAVIRSMRPLMTHSAGEVHERKFFTRTVAVTEQSPFRWYLDYRNLTWTICCYKTLQFKWTVLTLNAIMKRVILLLVFEHKRLLKLKAMCKGIAEGVSVYPRKFEQINWK